MRTGVRLLVVSFAIAASSAAATPQSGSKPELAGVISDLLANLAKGGAGIAFEVPAEVVNAYLGTLSRPGVRSAHVAFQPDGTIAVDAAVDLGPVKEWEPALFAKGKPLAKADRLQIRAVIRLKADEGRGTASLVSAKADPESIGPDAATAVVKAILRSQPERYEFDKETPLPFGLKRLTVAAGTIQGETR